MTRGPRFHPACRCIAGLVALAILASGPTIISAQAPGDPISTTILEPAATKTGTAAPDGAAIGEPEAGEAARTGAAMHETPTPGPVPEADGAGAAQDALPPLVDTTAGVPGDAPSGTGAEAGMNPRAPDAARDTAPDPSPPPVEIAPAATPVHEMLSGLWRAAVAAGETTRGYDAWLDETLGRASGANRSATPALPADMPSDQAGRTRLASERWLARAGPVALGEAGRVVTTFGAAIPTVFCAPLMVCYIELEPGEIITGTPSWGDTARWQVKVKGQGFDPETLLVEVKPAGDAQLTNIVIPTDRRVYTINLVNDPEVHTPILSFLYPDSAVRRFAEETAAREEREAEEKAAEDRRKAQAASARAAELARSGVKTETGTVPAERLDFGFRVEGKAPFRPVRVFADGRRTYIDLHPNYRGAMPVIVAGPGEDNAALNTRVTKDGTRLVADRVVADIWLQSGRKRIRIRKSGS